MKTPERTDIVRAKVRELLERSAAYKQLDAGARDELAYHLVKVTEFLAGTPEAAEKFAPQGWAENVDFPVFVSDLIKGVFDAMVNASIEQLNAYAELLKSVSASVDEFAVEDKAHEREATSAQKPRARPRQQLLATTVLMGINRVVVTNGKIV